MATVPLLQPAGDMEDLLRDRFRQEVLEGLSHPRKTIPARWFYDRRGSELFEQITAQPEYYLTRAEKEILAERCAQMALAIGPDRAVIEFGAGSAVKTPLLLEAVEPACYVPVDISGSFLRESCKALSARMPGLPVYPVEADFDQPFDLPREAQGYQRLGFFPGSTIGNFGPAAAVDLLRSMKGVLGEDGLLLIGMDLIKERTMLTAAYDDASGVTAAFNANLAERINRELDGTIPVEQFGHRAIWNADLARIEMHLEALRDLSFTVCGRRFTMRSHETIHTESSHKYDLRSATMLLFAGGWEPLARYCDRRHRFMVVLARQEGARISA